MPSLLGWLSRLFGRNDPGGAGNRRRAPGEPDLSRQVAQLQSGLDRVASEVSSLAMLITERGFDVRIDRVYIDEVNFDELSFNIDDIGVTDLGGALSIGINYGGRVVRPVRPRESPDSRARSGRTPAAEPGARQPAGDAGPRVNIRFGAPGANDGGGP